MPRRFHALVLSVAACGGSPASDPVPVTPIASIVAVRASEADVIVAQVDGRPVWGSCVTEQAARGAADRTAPADEGGTGGAAGDDPARAALDECIAFELLAQAAEQRGLAADPSVTDAVRTAMVSELVATEFEARYQKPQDLGATLDAVLDKNAWRMHRPDLRASAYVRAVVPPNAPPDVEPRAKQIAAAIAAELANETGLFTSHLRAVAERHSQGTGIEIESQDITQTTRTGSYEAPYLEALFAIPELGRISKPARTKRGWDVILWSGGLPAKESTREQLGWEVFTDLRRAQFTVWINQLIKDAGTSIELDEAAVSQLDEVAP